MARDQALLENAKLDLERYRTLFEQDSIAKQQLDTQDSLVRQYEGTVKVDQGLIDNARLQLTYCARHRADRRAHSACARSTRATSCTPATPTGWS